jgi:ABC-type glycerol-3-phosphate transport system substrate-binding protein
MERRMARRGAAGWPAASLSRRAMLGAGIPAMVATACTAGEAGQPAAGQPAANAKPVTLVYIVRRQPGTVGAEKDEQQFRLFGEQHPTITVQVDMVGGSADPKETTRALASVPLPVLPRSEGS